MLDLFCAETAEKALKRKDRRISFIDISNTMVEAKVILIPLYFTYDIIWGAFQIVALLCFMRAVGTPPTTDAPVGVSTSR